MPTETTLDYMLSRDPDQWSLIPRSMMSGIHAEAMARLAEMRERDGEAYRQDAAFVPLRNALDHAYARIHGYRDASEMYRNRK